MILNDKIATQAPELQGQVYRPDDGLVVKAPAWRSRAAQLDSKIAARIPGFRERIDQLVANYGSEKVGEITVSQIYGGNRGVHSIVSEISHVDPQAGIRLRGYTIPEILDKLPRAENSEYPLAGGVYFLLLVGEIPTLDEALSVEDEWKRRSAIPVYVFDVLRALPAEAHPMTMFSQAILALENESVFANRYEKGGIHKMSYWEATLEDSLNLTAKLPSIAAYIYNVKYRGSKYISPAPNLDWAANFAHMIEKSDDEGYQELCRLFFALHCDHEGGNASAHTALLVNSTLADIYYACSAGMNALAGPLHGLANQGCLRWLLEVYQNFNGCPTREQLENYAWETINAGRVIPGYGHAVLRVTDPRFSAQLEFGKKYLQADDLFKLVNLVYDVVPGVLTSLRKVKNPWPNVDAISGALQYHYGVHEDDFYTVLFGVSRVMGLTANAVWARALGLPLERPQSLTTEIIEKMVNHKGEQE